MAAPTAVEIATAAEQYDDVLIAGGVGYGRRAKQVVRAQGCAVVTANERDFAGVEVVNPMRGGAG